MYALCVSGAVNTQGFLWKFFYALYINFHSFIHYCITRGHTTTNANSLTIQGEKKAFVDAALVEKDSWGLETGRPQVELTSSAMALSAFNPYLLLLLLF